MWRQRRLRYCRCRCFYCRYSFLYSRKNNKNSMSTLTVEIKSNIIPFITQQKIEPYKAMDEFWWNFDVRLYLFLIFFFYLDLGSYILSTYHISFTWVHWGWYEKSDEIHKKKIVFGFSVGNSFNNLKSLFFFLFCSYNAIKSTIHFLRNSQKYTLLIINKKIKIFIHNSNREIEFAHQTQIRLIFIYFCFKFMIIFTSKYFVFLREYILVVIFVIVIVWCAYKQLP